MLATSWSAGCGRTVLVSEDSPMRVGPDVRGKVYTLQEGEWTISDDKIIYPEGWYLVPPSFVTKE